MSELNLVCLNFDESYLISQIESNLCEILPTKIQIMDGKYNLNEFFHKERQQYDAGRIIEAYKSENKMNKTILLASVDLYIPIFTFVFGLAKLNGGTGIVSVHRLKNEYYGLPSDKDLLISRLVKEIVHEFGHLLNLRHCLNYWCVMASSNTADDLDTKGDRFCSVCRDDLEY